TFSACLKQNKSRVSTKKTASPTEKHPQNNFYNRQMQNLNRLLEYEQKKFRCKMFIIRDD
ncbi:hypothetical protein, partial [Parabacteroides merdae]|uniref:hypothetical protein n=1 Tax=Parabacteroides merdae TaxID=46503 RepID=UPI0034A27067